MDVHALFSLFQVYDYNLSSKSEQHTVINHVMCHRNMTCVMRVWQELIRAPTIGARHFAPRPFAPVHKRCFAPDSMRHFATCST